MYSIFVVARSTFDIDPFFLRVFHRVLRILLDLRVLLCICVSRFIG